MHVIGPLAESLHTGGLSARVVYGCELVQTSYDAPARLNGVVVQYFEDFVRMVIALLIITLFVANDRPI
jgi:hypothetical protein